MDVEHSGFWYGRETMKKRFYRNVTTEAGSAGHRVLLDGRAVRSPAKRECSLPSEHLASAIATEWDSQQDEIDPATMPLFSLAVTVIDRVTPQRADLVAEMIAYGGSDLLCYRADDDELAGRQASQWQPWLEWSDNILGAPLEVASGIMPVTQPATSLARFDAVLGQHDDWELGALHRAVALSGSLVLGLAFLRGEIDHRKLFETAFLDELWQVERWGSDFEAEDRRGFIQGELDDVARFLGLLGAVR